MQIKSNKSNKYGKLKEISSDKLLGTVPNKCTIVTQ